MSSEKSAAVSAETCGGDGGAGTGMASSRSKSSKVVQVHAIRHGKTVMMEARERAAATGEAVEQLRDDPLSDVGKAQANKAFESFGRHWDTSCVVYVSPLSRALETAIRVFLGPEAAAACDVAPARVSDDGATSESQTTAEVEKIVAPDSAPGPHLIVDPLLREFSYTQRHEWPLPPRHQGHTIRELKRRFPLSNIVWPYDLDDAEYWEPHGSFTNLHSHDATPPQSASSRVRSFIRGLYSKMDDGSQVAIVAHENVLRVATGMVRLAPATPTSCFLTQPKVRMENATRAPSKPYLYMVPHSLVAERERAASLSPAPLTVYSVLGCSDPFVAIARVAYSLQQFRLARARGQRCFIVFVVAESEYAKLHDAIKDFERSEGSLSAQELSLMSIDPHSLFTECNANYTAALLGAVDCSVAFQRGSSSPAWQPWSVCLITNDWHMPRSLMAYEDQLKRNSWFWSDIQWSSVPTSCAAAEKYIDAHLTDGWILAHRVTLYPELWELAKPRLTKELQAVAAIMRIWAGRTVARTSDNADSATLLRAIQDCDYKSFTRIVSDCFRKGAPICHAVIDEHTGSTALHVAAKKGATSIVHDLLCFYGADPRRLNRVGMSSLDCARSASQAKALNMMCTFAGIKVEAAAR